MKRDITKIKGVNLGNWLVLEKWMNQALFAGVEAEDEYYLAYDLPEDVYRARINIHRSEFITERDFVTIHSCGFNTVRIPVPYFIFGDRHPFIGCIDELDKAFAWGEKYGIQILIDLHTAPGSQNGFDNGGISGICTWAKHPGEVEFVKTVLERLAERYGHRKGFWGIELINEPNTEAIWNVLNVEKRYIPRNKVMAAENDPVSWEFLEKFYLEVFERIHKLIADDKYIVIHDGFDLMHWKNFMQEDEFNCVVLDTHQYLMTAEMMGCEQSLEGYLKFINDYYAKSIEEMQQYFPVITGEWCLFNSLATGHDTHGGKSVLNGEKTESVELEESRKKEIYQALAKAQMAAWDKGSGFFYWSYKLLTDTVNTDGWTGWDSWDLGRCVDFGWFPTDRK